MQAIPDHCSTYRFHHRLTSGFKIPGLGFGTYDISAKDTQRVVEKALELGYRHLDCAASYYNETAVGAAIAASGIPRNELFITSKVRNCDQGPGTTRAALEKSLTDLGLDYLDLYLVHWPVPSKDLYVPTFHDIVAAQEDGLVRTTGVANFLEEHLTRIINEVGVTPAVNQFEVHPSFQQRKLRSFCAARGILVEAYCPLGRGADLQLRIVRQIAADRGVAPAQVVLAWHRANGLIPLPKSASPVRQAENLASTQIILTEEEEAAIDSFDNPSARICGDPATFDWPQAEKWVYKDTEDVQRK